MGDPRPVAPASTEAKKPRVFQVVTPAGEVADVDESDLDYVLRGDGYRLATEREVYDWDLQQKYGDQELRTFGESALRAATFTGSDYALEALGVDKADLAGRQEANPTAATLGEVAGFVVPALATGGTSTAAKVLSATPAGLVARGTNALTQALTRAPAAATALGRVAQTAKVAAVTGSVENALYGAAKAVDDDWLRNHEVTARRALLGGLEGAATGALGGALIGGGGKALAEIAAGSYRGVGRVVAAAKARAAAKAQANAELGQAVKVKISIDDALDQGLQPDAAIDALGPLTPDEMPPDLTFLRGARAAQGEAKAAREAAVTSIGEKGNRALDLFDEIEQVANVGTKRAHARELTWTAPVSPDEMIEPLEAIRIGMRDVLGHGDAALGSQAIPAKKLIKAVDEVEAKVRRYMLGGEVVDPKTGAKTIIAPGQIGEAWAELDRLKTYMGSLQRAAGGSAKRGAPYMREVEAAIAEVYKPLQAHLENEALYGALGAKQGVINKAMSSRITASKSDFVGGLFSRVGRVSRNGWDNAIEVNGPNIRGLVNQIGVDNASNQQLRDTRRYLRAMAVDAKTRARMLSDDPELLAKADELELLIGEIDDTLDDVTRKNAAEAAFNDKANSFWVDAIPAGLGRTGLGIVRGLGSAMPKIDIAVEAVQKAAAKATSEAESEAVARAVYEGAVKGEQAARDAAEGFFANLKRGYAKPGSFKSRAVSTGTFLGTRLSLGTPSGYEAAVNRIAALRDPDSDERNELRGRMASVHLDEPAMGDAIEAEIQKRADFLAEKAGIPRAPDGSPFSHLKPPVRTNGQAEKLARYARALNEPLGALDRIKKGEVLEEDVEVLRRFFPEAFDRIVADVVARSAEINKRPSAEALRAYRLLTGGTLAEKALIGELQMLAESGIGAAAQRADDEQAAGAQSQSGQAITPGRARPPDLAGSMMTSTQKQKGQ